MNERPYWFDTVDQLQSQNQSQLQNPKSAIPSAADVVVVGGGYTGLSAARRLARTGASVVVIERGTVGFGASSRNAGQVLTGLRLDPATLVRRYGEASARTLFDSAVESVAHLEALIAAESIDCEYERTGHIQAAWKPAHFDGFREEQALLARVFNHRVELVSKSDQRREIGSDRYHGLLIDSHSGALNPARYVNGLAMAAARSGATIATGVNVERIARDGDRWTVATSRGDVRAREVLVATNGYTGPATPRLRRGIIPIGSYVVATAPLAEEVCSRLLPKRRMAYDSKQFLFYFRITSDRRLLFGGRVSFTPQTANTVRRTAGILRRGIATIFPELSGVEIEYAWGGFVAFARDERPHAGRLDDGMYFATGYAGHGIAMATMLGDVTARRIAGEPVNHPFMDDRLPSIPFYSGSPWFLPFVGAYYQVMDWIS